MGAECHGTMRHVRYTRACRAVCERPLALRTGLAAGCVSRGGTEDCRSVDAGRPRGPGLSPGTGRRLCTPHALVGLRCGVAAGPHPPRLRAPDPGRLNLIRSPSVQGDQVEAACDVTALRIAPFAIIMEGQLRSTGDGTQPEPISPDLACRADEQAFPARRPEWADVLDRRNTFGRLGHSCPRFVSQFSFGAPSVMRSPSHGRIGSHHPPRPRKTDRDSGRPRPPPNRAPERDIRRRVPEPDWVRILASVAASIHLP